MKGRRRAAAAHQQGPATLTLERLAALCAGPRERMRVAFEAKAVADDTQPGVFEGMASVFGSQVNAWIPTIVEPGAFTRTLLEDKARVKLLWQHEPWNPIGKPLVLEERPAGLFLKGKVSDTSVGRDAITLMRDGVVDELSIGFDPVTVRMEGEGAAAVRHILEAKLWEVSLVTWAADPLAQITSVHGLGAQAFRQLVGGLRQLGRPAPAATHAAGDLYLTDEDQALCDEVLELLRALKVSEAQQATVEQCAELLAQVRDMTVPEAQAATAIGEQQARAIARAASMLATLRADATERCGLVLA